MSDGAEVDFAFGTEIRETSTAAMAPAPSIAPTVRRGSTRSAFEEARELTYVDMLAKMAGIDAGLKEELQLLYRSPAYLEEAGEAWARGAARGLNRR